MTSYTTIIGIDCACQAKDVGMARAQWHEGRTTVTDVLCGKDVRSIPVLVGEWMGAANRCLLALDAPLGWPRPMGEELGRHVAGGAIGVQKDDMFRRETDRDIKTRFRKTPLDVGADRIARTAHSALCLLHSTRELTGLEIPLAWNPAPPASVCAIEVYPAGTLLAHGMPASGYKKPTQRNMRTKIINSLKTKLCLEADPSVMLDDADCLDAVLCVLAAADFVEGRAVPPSNLSAAKKEGWIWVCDRVESSEELVE
jgi:hypothetical protein